MIAELYVPGTLVLYYIKGKWVEYTIDSASAHMVILYRHVKDEDRIVFASFSLLKEQHLNCVMFPLQLTD